MSDRMNQKKYNKFIQFEIDRKSALELDINQDIVMEV